MLTAARLGIQDLAGSWRLALAMVLLVALPFQGFLVLDGLARGGNSEFEPVNRVGLSVQDAGGVGEVFGSRIPASLEQELLAMGASPAIPEIHSIAGTSAQDAVLVRGIDMERYQAATLFDILEGRPLRPGDPPRSAMIGETLAESAGVGAGEAIAIRGRDFDVVGVFAIGTFEDNEAWISLDAARELLGWGDEVSLFLIDEPGPLAPGDVIRGSVGVVQRGEAAKLGQAWNPIGALLRIAAAVVVIAGAIILSTLLWRLAWLRRIELAILRSMGLPRRVHAGYLGAQAMTITIVGVLVGWIVALIMAATIRFDAVQVVIEPILSVPITLAMATGALGLGLGGAAVPLLWLLRTQPASLLRRG
jgi:putative ABC transport system permease protein